MQILQNQKHAFWQALVLSLLVFAFGIFLGYLLESSRVSEISNLYAQAELDMADARIQSDIYSVIDFNCNVAIQENINFAERIYNEAKLLEKYEAANMLSESIKLQHKKYDLLRTLFWVNSIKIRQRCNASYHNLVYLYDYNSPSLDAKAKQSVFSRVLAEIKQDKGSGVMLIPIAGDNEIFSLTILMSSYGLSEKELPVILIDEKIKITEITTKEDFEKYL